MIRVTDDKGIEVDDGVFPELATVKDTCLVIYTDGKKTKICLNIIPI